MKKLFLFLITSFLTFVAQNIYAQNSITANLQELGFENIRCKNEKNVYYISIENRSYRSDAYGITLALNSISSELNEDKNINLLLLENELPQLLVQVQANSWKKFKSGKISKEEFVPLFKVTRNVREIWNILKNNKPENPAIKQADLIIYPGFAFKNNRMDKIYETKLELKPALEHCFWPGNKIVAQVIFPIHNEFGYESDFIRPGYATVAQKFIFGDQWTTILNAGNFNQNRYGFRGTIQKPIHENWIAEMNAGYTGSSYFYDSKWDRGKMNTFTGSASLSYFWSRFNMNLEGGIAKYIYDDKGIFGSVTRYFGETSVEFFASTGTHEFNGGFVITVPLFSKKRLRKGNVIKLTIPESFSLTYNSGNEQFLSKRFLTKERNNKLKMRNLSTLIRNQIVNY